MASSVTYRVEFGGGAQAQFHNPLRLRRDALVERAVELSEQPWDAFVRPPRADPRFQETTFALGTGIIGFYVDDDARRSGSSTSSGSASSRAESSAPGHARSVHPPSTAPAPSQATPGRSRFAQAQEALAKIQVKLAWTQPILIVGDPLPVRLSRSRAIKGVR